MAADVTQLFDRVTGKKVYPLTKPECVIDEQGRSFVDVVNGASSMLDAGTALNAESERLVGELGNYEQKIDGKQPLLQNTVNIKSINGESILGEGDLKVAGGGVGKVDETSTEGTGEIFNDTTNNVASGAYSHAEGELSTASGKGAHAEGGKAWFANGPKAIGDYSHAEGVQTTAQGSFSHVEGLLSSAIGSSSHAEGSGNKAEGDTSHGEGENSSALGRASHVEGYACTAKTDYSHAEGYFTHANGKMSHAEGNKSTAARESSHAEGYSTTAGGSYSHAEGWGSFAKAQGSHAEGLYTVAGNGAEHAEGMYNKSNFIEVDGTPIYTISSIGIGASEQERRNAVEVLRSGAVYVNGIGTYDGTNPTAENSLQAFLKNFKGSIDEAPADGKQYARQNGAWSEIVREEGVNGFKVISRQDYDALVEAGTVREDVLYMIK